MSAPKHARYRQAPDCCTMCHGSFVGSGGRARTSVMAAAQERYGGAGHAGQDTWSLSDSSRPRIGLGRDEEVYLMLAIWGDGYWVYCRSFEMFDRFLTKDQA